jgi:hypothetical protein
MRGERFCVLVLRSLLLDDDDDEELKTFKSSKPKTKRCPKKEKRKSNMMNGKVCVLFSLLPMWFGQGTSPVFSMQQIFLTSSTVPFCTQKTKRKIKSCVSSPIMFPISSLYQIIKSISGISMEFRCCC